MKNSIIDQYESKIIEISDLLKKRAAVYPVRDEVFVQLCKAIEGFTESLLKTMSFERFQPEKGLLSETERFAEHPIFICGSMKSGTTLLCQLLDNHPNLLVMPWDSHYTKHIKKWKRTQFPDISAYWLHTLINPSGKEPFWFLGKERTVFETFLQYLHYFLTHTQRDIFVCGVLAIYAANRNRLRSHHIKYWVEKTPHNELKAPMLHARFPHSIFIHILRDPLTNIPSLMRLSRIRNWGRTPGKYAHSIKKLFRAARYNQKVIGKNKYHIIRYEDLVSKPKQTLTGICEILNIPFDETLLVPTENGRPGISNSMYIESRVEGQILDQSRNERYKKELSEEELKDIVAILYPDAITLGYDWNRDDIVRYKRTFLQQNRIRLLSYLKRRLRKL